MHGFLKICLSFSMTAILRPSLYTAFATSRPEPLPITIRSNVFVLDTQVNCIIHNLYLFSVIEMCQWICHYARNKRFHYSFSFSLCTQYNNCWLLYCNRVNTFVILYETKPSNSLLTLLLFVVVVKKKSHIMLMIVSKKFIVVIEF